MAAERHGASAPKWPGIAALAIATLFLLCGVAAIVMAYRREFSFDFAGFWAAGRLALEGQPASAYDVAQHHAVMVQAIPSAGLLPFVYPPFALALFAAFALLPLWLGFALFTTLSAAIYIAATWRWIAPRFALAQAGAAANLITGQNGFLTAAIFVHGTSLLARRPFTAGAVLGLLSFKPQLGILVPVALLAAREWRALAGAAASFIALLILGLLLFGPHAFAAFVTMLPQVSDWFRSGHMPPWGELASLFALLRWFGVPQTAALLAHSVVALGAVAVTWRAWWLRLGERVPILAAATLLISPYLFTYDALLLTAALAALNLRRDRRLFVAVWILSLLPVLTYVLPLPNSLPLAALLSLWALHRAQTPLPSYQV